MPQERLENAVEEERERVATDLTQAFKERDGSPSALREILEEARPEDVADALTLLNPSQRLAVYRAVPEEDREVVIEEADPLVTAQLLSNLEAEEIIGLLEEMPPDDAADVMLQLPDGQRTVILRGIERSDPKQAEDIRELLEFDPDSAGGMMTTEFVRISETATAGSAIATIQGAIDAETINTIFVTDASDRLVGVVSIRQLLTQKPLDRVSDFMEREVISARVTDEQGQAAGLLERYNLQVLPIIDENDVMRGIITVDDVLDAIREEFDADLFKLAGTATPEYLGESVLNKAQKRLPWLLITLGLGLLLAFLLSVWEPILKAHTELAFFLPVLAGLAGNASIQAATLMVRNLNNESLEYSSWRQTILTELRVGLSIGLICGSLIFFGALIIGGWRFGLVVSFALLVAVTNATILGTVVPLGFDRIGVDPALSSGPFITTLNDVLSMMIYLTLANLLL